MNELRDIVVPDAVSLLPHTWAWAILFVALATGLLLLARAAVRRHRANRYRRAALAELDDIRSRNAWNELPALVKRVALQVWPRKQVAASTGPEWLAFLDRSYEGGGFADSGLYEGESKAANVVGEWIRKHHA